jgi:hypothetical protein
MDMNATMPASGARIDYSLRKLRRLLAHRKTSLPADKKADLTPFLGMDAN